RVQQCGRSRRRHDQAGPGDDPRPVRRSGGGKPGARRRCGGGPAVAGKARAIIGPPLPAGAPSRAVRQARRAATARPKTRHRARLEGWRSTSMMPMSEAMPGSIARVFLLLSCSSMTAAVLLLVAGCGATEKPQEGTKHPQVTVVIARKMIV